MFSAMLTDAFQDGDNCTPIIIIIGIALMGSFLT